MKENKIVFLILFLSLIVRFGLFYTKWDDLRHGTALDYASTAIGFYNGQGLSTSSSEIEKIGLLTNNFSGNYLEFYEQTQRQEFTEFLPGPAILLSILWKIVPIHNFAPYIWFQIILESILILLFYALFYNKSKYVVLFTSIFMVFNVPAINKTLMVGYDFWPQFTVLVTFIGVYYAIIKNKSYLFFITGLLASVTVWFRSITSLLPFFIVLIIFVYQKFYQKKGTFVVLKNSAYYILPFILLIASLSIFRYNQTGDYRPTRSTFWHSFFCGVGRFSNPYHIKSNDLDVWALGQKLNPNLENSSLGYQYNLPNSLYEITLKKEAFNFIKKYPHLFIRNIFYRIGIMISPPLKVGNTNLVPNYIKNSIFPIGIALLFLWFIGLFYLYKNDRLLLYLCLSIYFYFFAAFSWFYVPGRAILPFLFINFFIYLSGIKFLIIKFKKQEVICNN